MGAVAFLDVLMSRLLLANRVRVKFSNTHLLYLQVDRLDEFEDVLKQEPQEPASTITRISESGVAYKEVGLHHLTPPSSTCDSECNAFSSEFSAGICVVGY